MQSIALLSEERKELVRLMKRESRPSSRLRMHVVLLVANGCSPTHICRVLFCSRTTVYDAVARRFCREGRAAFYDREKRGPRGLLDESAQERIETLVEERSPVEHGWLRSRWSCKLLALELFKERALVVSRETVRRALHRLGFRWRRPRPVPPSKDPQQKRKRLEDILEMLRREWSFFQDETKLETNPRVGFCWMRRGEQKRLRTPGTNRKVRVSGALRWSTGRFHWVVGERKNDELFMKLLGELRSIYRSEGQRLELAVDNDGSHTSKRVERYVEDSGGRLSLHPLPAWSPQSNPVELIWWGLHEAVSRNHDCEGLSDLVEFAEGYLEERQPSRLELGEDYQKLERRPPRERQASIYLVELSSARSGYLLGNG